LDAALSGGQARDDVWWLPEVMRQRAHFDPPNRAESRLADAAELARRHGSLALVARCGQDGPPPSTLAPATGVRPRD
jgi:hypothetical protein